MTDALTFAADFPPATKDAWLRAVRGVILKSKPDASDDEFSTAFERQLVTRTEDGIEIRPLYSAEDVPVTSGLPGFAPFVRSSHAAPTPWEIRQRVCLDADGSSAVGELESGATGVLLEVGDDVSTPALEAALEGVLLDLAPVSLSSSAPDGGAAAARLLLQLWSTRDVAPAARLGSLGVDPIGAWARSGGAVDLDAAFDAAAAVLREAADGAPHAHVLVLDGTVWHEAGATDAQELGWSVAAGAAVVRALAERGLEAATTCARLELRLAGTADQFATIAKVRAARRLWARVAELSGLAAQARTIRIHVEGSRVMMTRYDPWVNALRSTVACFSAAVGGADAITIQPHDALRTRGGSALGCRIARNTQTVLQMESNLARVVDPAGGSWYVEQRTEDVARAAWAALQQVEVAGGIVAAVGAGSLHAAIDAVAADRRTQLATRKRAITGVSEFPDISEEPPPPLAPATAATASTPFPPFTLHRFADGYEEQRGRADAHATATGTRPTVFLAALGPAAVHTTRATFAKNLFEAAGMRTVAGAVEEFASSGTSVACLCSSDAVYAESGAAAVAALRAAGATRVYLAGRKVGLDGVDEEVGMGTDVLEALGRALDELGVSR